MLDEKLSHIYSMCSMSGFCVGQREFLNTKLTRPCHCGSVHVIRVNPKLFPQQQEHDESIQNM